MVVAREGNYAPWLRGMKREVDKYKEALTAEREKVKVLERKLAISEKEVEAVCRHIFVITPNAIAEELFVKNMMQSIKIEVEYLTAQAAKALEGKDE